MSEDIKVTDGTVLESLNGKVDLDGGNYAGSPLEAYIHKHCGGGLEIGDIGFTQMAIDETKGKRRVLNGQLIIQEQYVQFTNIIKNSVALNPDLACTEEKWQTAVTMSTNGVCDKFVIDDNAGTIRLPKYPNYLDLTINTGAKTQTVSVYGTGKTLGLTDGSGNYALWGNQNGMLPSSSYGATLPNSTSSFTSQSARLYGITNDSTKSGLTGKVTVPAVQSEKIKGTYFIQVATGAETEDNIINEIELNNPFSLLDYKYSEYELNNLSWLRSNGQWNSKIVYPAVYELLLKIYNGTETKAGVSVKLATENYSDTDFVLNTADETFRLPIKVKLASGKAVVGNGMTLGMTNGEQNFGIYAYNESGTKCYLSQSTDNYGSTVGIRYTSKPTTNNGYIAGVTTEPEYSGIETSDKDLYLYFYVGETVQNANLINAGRIEEKIASLIPDNSSLISGYAMPSNKYIDLTLGASGTAYTAPANGWVVFIKNSTNATHWAELGSNGIYAKYQGDGYAEISIPVRKGATFRTNYTVTGDTIRFQFIYAEGEQ